MARMEKQGKGKATPSARQHDDRLPAVTAHGGDGVQQGAVDALRSLCSTNWLIRQLALDFIN
jgi:hypothetical protein